MHPLDPLTADEFRQVVGDPRPRARGGRALAVRVDRAQGAGEGRRPRRTPATGRREALAVCWNSQDNQAYRAVVVADRRRACGWTHLPGQHPNMTVDEWHECDVRLRADPRLAEALARRGITDLDLVLIDVWAYGARAGAGAVPGPADRLGRHLVRATRGRQPLRPPGHRAASDRRPQHAWSCWRSRTTDVAAEPPSHGRVRAGARARARAARGSSRWTSPSPTACRSPSTATC